MTDDATHERLVKQFYRDRRKAHRVLFKHRHGQSMCEAQYDFLDHWHSPQKFINFLAFRGFAKSTLAEEAIALDAGFRAFKNCVIIGANEDRAIDRLNAIRHELKHNEMLEELFGKDIVLVVDSDVKIVLANGVCIQAIGRGQELRGIKHHEQRPDFFVCDDLETRADVRTPKGRADIANWFFTELIPACDQLKVRGRCLATPRDADALPMKLQKDKAWLTCVYPVVYIDEDAALRATWPDRFPLSLVEEMRESFITQGMLREFNMEYMCEAESAADKTFKSETFRIEPTVRTWQAAYAMFDPARTANKATSATTGFACWSWIGNRLIVWDAWGKFLLPDEIIEEVFACHESFHPTFIGVEEDGLNEFLMQPLRQAQLKRSTIIPLRAMKAPKGKTEFIQGLQPFFTAREVIFAKPLPDLEAQLKSFPTGRIDAPNALAYALRMRPGAPFYEGFGMRHVTEELHPVGSTPAWLCLNTDKGITTAILAQVINGSLKVYRDWVREGDAPDRLRDIVQEAHIEYGRTPRLVCHPRHFDKFNNKGLVQAARHLPMEIRRGGDIATGRIALRRLLEREVRSIPALQLDSEASWTLNGLAGGYSRMVAKTGIITEDADESPYKTLLEGLETFCALMGSGSTEDDDSDKLYATTPSGIRYATLRR